jgi:hypothetical protein
MIQIIDKQYNGWQIGFNGVKLFFTPKPIRLYHGFKEIEADVSNGLRWRFKGKWISYKQIKETIELYKQHPPKRITHDLSVLGIYL